MSNESLEVEIYRAKCAQEIRRRHAAIRETAAHGWRAWLGRHFPRYDASTLAPRHVDLWNWFEALQDGILPADPVDIRIWPRGGGKSTSAELGVAFVGSRFRRRFVLYVSGTQGQANKHTQAIAPHFDKIGLQRATNRYGNSLGWRMDMLRVAGGFNVLALGLDAAGRGVKLDDYRPDLIILDDIDSRHDSEKAVEKKVHTLTESILPMGAPFCAVLVIQNLIHAHSIVSQLAENRADFLHARTVQQEAALDDFDPDRDLRAEGQPDGTIRYRITRGRATWSGQDVATCEHQLNTWGRIAFVREAQHDLREVEGGLWKRSRDIDPFRIPKPAEEYERIVVAIDPNSTGRGDDAGIVVGGRRRVLAGLDPHTHRPRYTLHADILEDATEEGGPTVWAQLAVAAYERWKADGIVAESNNGGDMVRITISTVSDAPRVELVHASRGKATRAAPVQKVCGDGRVHHVGVLRDLERELCSWREGEPSPNRLDAYVWLVTSLLELQDEVRLMPWYPGKK